MPNAKSDKQTTIMKELKKLERYRDGIRRFIEEGKVCFTSNGRED